MDKFWVIHNAIPRNVFTNQSAVQHHSLEAAERETERLVCQNPGEVFVILEAMKCCKKQEILWSDIE